MTMITNTLEGDRTQTHTKRRPSGTLATCFRLIFLTSVAPFAMPQLVQKFYAIRDRRSIRIGMIASTFFALLIGGVAYYIGSTTRVFHFSC